MNLSASSRRQGVALVLVLAFLVLITVFIVGFFSSATSELNASSSWAASVNTRQLSDAATGIVIGQIRQATTRQSDIVKDPKLDFDSWASQPGMIRTFPGGPQANGTDTSGIYKLYSSDRMILNGKTEATGFLGLRDIPVGAGSAGWQARTAIFTDLNEPVLTADPDDAKKTITRYPIFDPAAFKTTPVRSAANSGVSVVEGAEVTADPNLPSAQQYSRMPVRWLYTLKDGTVATPSSFSDSGKKAVFDKTKVHPTADNPIVGRIAFWADDDTCKVNINTAGGYSLIGARANEKDYAGSFWDTPRLATPFDMGNVEGANNRFTILGLSGSQPAAGEYQRYAGHPATTSLAMVFTDLSSKQIYNLSPRLIGGGSEGGTLQTKSEIDAPITPKVDRLYASVDEMLYASDPALAVAQAAGQRVRAEDAVGSNTGSLSPRSLDKLRFFLTAHSRAPELNLFGRPRITLWPVWPIFGSKSTALKFPHYEYAATSNSFTVKSYGREEFRGLCTAHDKLIAFCSTIGKGLDDPDARPYIFQRYDPYSSKNDSLIPRNLKLLQYLQELTNTPVPGFGGAFTEAGKMGPERDQVLAEIFDYIRCVNLRDSTRDVPPNMADGKAPSGGTSYNTYKFAPRGIVVPSVISSLGNATGLGRFPTISEISIDFYHAGYLMYDPAKKTANGGNGYYYSYNRAEAHAAMADMENGDYSKKRVVGKMIGAFLILECFNPMQGFSTTSSFDQRYEAGASGKSMFIMHEVTGLNTMAIKTASLGTYKSLQMPKGATNAFFSSSADTWGGRNWGGAEGFMYPMLRATAAIPGTDPLTTVKNASSSGIKYWYPFQSTPDGANGFPVDAAVLAGDPGDPKGGAIQLPAGAINPVTHRPSGALNPPNGVLVRQGDTQFAFRGGLLQIDVKWGQEPTAPINTYVAKFPDSQREWPIPTDNIWAAGAYGGNGDYGGFYQDPDLTHSVNPGAMYPQTATTQFGWQAAGEADASGAVLPSLQFFMNARLRWCFRDSNEPSLQKTGGTGLNNRRRWRQILQPGDTIRSLIPQNPGSKTSVTGRPDGDPRVMAMLGPLSSGADDRSYYFGAHPYYFTTQRHAETLRNADSSHYIYRDSDSLTATQTSKSLEDDTLQNPLAGKKGSGVFLFPPKYTKFGNMVQGVTYTLATAATIPPTIDGVLRNDGQAGDFDSGTGRVPDGAYSGKADEGTFAWKYWDSNSALYNYGSPYYVYPTQASFGSYFSPNRQISSAVAFGSLLSGRKKAWQTLAFSPNPLGRNHPGISAKPLDHLLLDLFTMPVVEPYAISEPLSTAGKVNMNYAIEPFTYIKRSTAMRAVLQSVRVTAIPVTAGQTYKAQADILTNYRYLIDRNLTIGLMDRYFYGASGPTSGTEDRIFRSASQICEQYLVPKDPPEELPTTNPQTLTPQMMAKWWDGEKLTADNMREKPYGDLYPRLTTKSNTYTVYMRVQTLRKVVRGADDAAKAKAYLEWDDAHDQVLSEYRGSATIERYIDPQDPRIVGRNPESGSVPNGVDPDKHSIESVYKFRVVESKRFQP